MEKIIPTYGDSDWNNTYTGTAWELTVDTSNGDLRLHDGSTPGGFTIAKVANLDQRFQAKSQELSGFTEFEPQQRGFLARIGPASYRLRSLVVNTANLVVANADGFDGNPAIGLNPIISSEHTWTGQQLFQEVVEFSAGINADVSGNLTGDVAGNLTGDVIGNVTGDLLGNTEGNHVGGIDVQGASVFFDDGQIPLAALNGLLAFVKTNGIPMGVVVAWSGAEIDIPAGWFLCDGLNGTPDLRNQFLVGAGSGSDYEVGDSGGAAAVTPAISVASAGAHTHVLSGSVASASSGVSLNVTIVRPENEQHQVDVVGAVTLTDPGHSHAQGGTADSNGAHIHVATSSTVSTLPPYYALCYIMKG